MARTIPHRELRNDSSRVLEEVRNGETIHITNHGKIVATLIPPQPEPPLAVVRPARHSAWGALEILPAPGGLTSGEILDDLRGER